MKLREVDYLALLTTAVCIGLGIASYNALNPDGVSYLDLAGRLMNADWRHFVQGYWSPLYPVLIAIAAVLTGREGAGLIAPVHVLNTLIALFGVAVVWWAARRSDNLLFGRAAFAALLVCSARAPRVEAVTPDLLLVALVALVANELLFFAGARWIRLGVYLGLAFLAKTSMWPWLIVAVVVRLIAVPSRTARMTVVKSTGVSLAVMMLWLAPLAIRYDGPSLGSAARLNACWYMRECDSRSPDTHTAQHRRYQELIFGSSQATVAMLGSSPWTYSPWSDPTQWAEGVVSYGGVEPSFSQHVGYAFKQLSLVMLAWTWHVSLLILLPVAWLTKRRGVWRELVSERRDALVVMLLGAAGILQFVAVHVEPRLIAPFVLLFTLGALAWLCGLRTPGGEAVPVSGNKYLLLALSLAGIVGTLPRAWVHGREQWLIASSASERTAMIRRSEVGQVPARVGPRRIAVVGEVFPLLNEAYRLDGRVELQVLRPKATAVLAWPPGDQQALVAWLAAQGVNEVWLNKGGGAFSILTLQPR